MLSKCAAEALEDALWLTPAASPREHREERAFKRTRVLYHREAWTQDASAPPNLSVEEANELFAQSPLAGEGPLSSPRPLLSSDDARRLRTISSDDYDDGGPRRNPRIRFAPELVNCKTNSCHDVQQPAQDVRPGRGGGHAAVADDSRLVNLARQWWMSSFVGKAS